MDKVIEYACLFKIDKCLYNLLSKEDIDSCLKQIANETINLIAEFKEGEIVGEKEEIDIPLDDDGIRYFGYFFHVKSNAHETTPSEILDIHPIFDGHLLSWRRTERGRLVSPGITKEIP